MSVLKKRSLSFLVVLLTTLACNAQHLCGLNNRWKYTRSEFVYGIGATNFLGDLGGLNRIASHYSFADLELVLTRPALNIGYRYRLGRQLFFIKTSLTWSIVSGDDKLTQERFRNNRNLSFRSNIVELSSQLEIPLSVSKVGYRFRFRPLGNRKKVFRVNTFLFAGIGVFYFNPQAQYKGSWVSLQPLGTEGQGLPGAPPKYSRIALSFPIGLLFKFYMSRTVTLGIELGLRKTTTDYIDDVSGNYYDNATLLAQRGAKAAELADPNLKHEPQQLDEKGKTRAGYQRGDPFHKDSYMMGIVSLNYSLYKFKRKFRAKF